MINPIFIHNTLLNLNKDYYTTPPQGLSTMATVQNVDPKHTVKLQANRRDRDAMNNEVSSSSDDSNGINETLSKFNKYYKARYQANLSDNETEISRRPLQTRGHHKSMGNLNESYREITSHSSISNIDINLHSADIKKFESLQIPIVGYEVMEERARFTIYKLKVEDDKRDQSWLVFRRYTDFVRLYNRIKSELPDMMLPLPGKRWFRDNFEPAFLEERVRGLQVFINAVLSKSPNHPVVRDFFCLDEPPQVFSYQPEVQAVYGALEDSITNLKVQLKQKDATIMHLQKQIARLDDQTKNCPTCSTNKCLK